MTLLELCEKLNINGKNVSEGLPENSMEQEATEDILVKFIRYLLDKVVALSLKTTWQPGKPTKSGKYLVRIRYDLGEENQTTAEYVEPFSPHSGWYNIKPPSEISAEEWCKKNGIEVIAWREI